MSKRLPVWAQLDPVAQTARSVRVFQVSPCWPAATASQGEPWEGGWTLALGTGALCLKIHQRRRYCTPPCRVGGRQRGSDQWNYKGEWVTECGRKCTFDAIARLGGCVHNWPDWLWMHSGEVWWAGGTVPLTNYGRAAAHWGNGTCVRAGRNHTHSIWLRWRGRTLKLSKTVISHLLRHTEYACTQKIVSNIIYRTDSESTLKVCCVHSPCTWLDLWYLRCSGGGGWSLLSGWTSFGRGGHIGQANETIDRGGWFSFGNIHWPHPSLLKLHFSQPLFLPCFGQLLLNISRLALCERDQVLRASNICDFEHFIK